MKKISTDYNFYRRAVLDKAIDSRLRTEALDRLLLLMGAVVPLGELLIPTPTYEEVVELVKDHEYPKAMRLLREVMEIDIQTSRNAVDIIEAEVKAAATE